MPADPRRRLGRAARESEGMPRGQVDADGLCIGGPARVQGDDKRIIEQQVESAAHRVFETDVRAIELLAGAESGPEPAHVERTV